VIKPSVHDVGARSKKLACQLAHVGPQHGGHRAEPETQVAVSANLSEYGLTRFRAHRANCDAC
jgi:hypothetical protein